MFTDETTAGDDESLADEDLFAALCSERRLQVLRHLHDEGGATTFASLVDSVAAAENDKAPAELTQTERRRIYISLYQTHLPKLDEQGLIEWDHGEDAVVLRSDDRLTAYLLDDQGALTPWHRYYVATAAGGALLTALVVFGVDGFGAVDPLVAGSVVVSAMFSLAAVHRFSASP